jgi:hypothetical protein
VDAVLANQSPQKARPATGTTAPPSP